MALIEDLALLTGERIDEGEIGTNRHGQSIVQTPRRGHARQEMTPGTFSLLRLTHIAAGTTTGGRSFIAPSEQRL